MNRLSTRDEERIRDTLMKMDLLAADLPSKGKRNQMKNLSSRIRTILNKAKRRERWKKTENMSQQA